MSWHNFKSWFDNSVHCCWKRVRKRSGVDQEKSERRNEAGTTRRSRCPKQQVFFCQDLLHRGPFGDVMLEGQERRTKRKRRRKRRRSERFQSSFLIFLGQSSLSLSLPFPLAASLLQAHCCFCADKIELVLCKKRQSSRSCDIELNQNWLSWIGAALQLWRIDWWHMRRHNILMDFVQEKAPPPEEHCASLCTQNVQILKLGRL